MAEKTFKSPGFFPREVELQQKPLEPFGTPATVIGTAQKGPAFVPVLLGQWRDFLVTFGDTNEDMIGPYAVREFLRNATAAVYMRVLGGGTATVDATNGTVSNAGFRITGSSIKDGSVQFLCGYHSDTTNSGFLGQASGSASDQSAGLVRAVIFNSGSKQRIYVGDITDGDDPVTLVLNDTATTTATDKFHLYLYDASLAWTGGNVSGKSYIRKLTGSLNPSDSDYVGNILNTDPEQFDSERHLLYLDFPVDVERSSATLRAVEILSGSQASGFGVKFGDFRKRYTTPQSPYVISQRFGTKKYDLFYTEALSDGAWANDNIKISVSNIRKPVSDTELYGTFNLVVRKFDDTDSNPIILEQHTNLTLDPSSENYIVRRIGDKKVYFDWDQSDDDERRLVITGDFANKSNYIRILPSNELKNGEVPAEALPWGFKGYKLLHTKNRLYGNGATLENSVVPPIPFRVNIAKKSSNNKTIDAKLYWGVHFERTSGSAESGWSGRNDGYINASSKHNNCLDSMAKFMGIEHTGMDVLLTGSDVNEYSATQGSWENEFSLEKVFTDSSSSKVSDAKGWQYKGTYALAAASPFVPTTTYLNTFAQVAKFTFFLAGGFDGVDLLDKNALYLRDSDVQPASFTARGVTHGNSLSCNTVKSYRTAIDIFENPENVDTNVLAVPDMRDPLITDYALDACESRFDCLYIMDMENVDGDSNTIYTNPAGQTGAGTKKPAVSNTISALESRAMDSNMGCVYWPDVRLRDESSGKTITVPPSVVVLGAFAFNDKYAQPWFAPAGFNRGGLNNVSEPDVNLTFSDRDDLYDANINPIAKFPREGTVILGQKTLQAAQSALDRVNVRRMILEVRRAVKGVAQRILFEPNNFATWTKFTGMVTPILERIQAQSGLERFKVVIDDSTTSQSDIDNNTLRGKIFIQPTKSIEFIAVDFIIANSGVTFQ